jgi:hypothetical protein
MKFLIGYPLLLCLLICCTEEYKLSVDVSGNGTCEVSPQKSNYEEGETVTLTAIPDSGWLFNKWNGSETTNYNPLYLRMDGDKYLELVFDIPYKPSMTGDWDGIQYNIEFHIQQAVFDSSLTGTLVLHLSNGGNPEYSVIGYNTKTAIRMECKRSGYYDITYTGWWTNQSRIDGGVRENGVYYECDLQRSGDSPLAGRRQLFSPGKLLN